MKRLVLFYCFFLCLSIYGMSTGLYIDSVSAVNEDRYFEQVEEKVVFTSKKWEEAKNNISFGQEKKENKKEEKKQPLDLGRLFPSFNFQWLQYVLISGIIGLLCWAILYYVQPNLFRFNRKISRNPEIEFGQNFSKPSNPSEIFNLNDALESYLANKEYHEAIRIVYMMVLQELSKAKIVAIKKDSPNNSILRAIPSKELKESTRIIFKKYENAWYGKKAVTVDDLELTRTEYSVFIKKLSS